MEHIVLGLLILKSMTIYELNQAFSQGLSMIYAASYGNLQYAVKKLIKNNMIAFVEKVENGRNKKIYNIKDDGVNHFFKWMMDDIDPKHVETLMLAKIYFLGLIESADDKIIIIDKIIDAGNEYSKGLYEVKTATDNLELPDEYLEIAKYQFKTLDYGIGTYKFTIEWLMALRDNIN